MSRAAHRAFRCDYGNCDSEANEWNLRGTTWLAAHCFAELFPLGEDLLTGRYRRRPLLERV